MYYTCTVNPALDYFLSTENLQIGAINRVESGSFHIGGKGIIVSRVLNIIGAQTTTLGFVGGFTGQYLIDQLEKDNITTNFVQVNDNTRINVIISSDSETDINAAGPNILRENFTKLLKIIESSLTEKDTFFLCGNSAPGMLSEDYLQICQAVNKAGARLIVDTNTDLLVSSLKSKPWLIKPNHLELGKIIGRELVTIKDCIEGAQEIKKLGARNVLVSRGGDGAVFLSEDGNIKLSVDVAKTSPNKQTIGAGDTMLASFTYQFDQTNDFSQALAFASSAGGATVESDDLATNELINTYLKQILITDLT